MRNKSLTLVGLMAVVCLCMGFLIAQPALAGNPTELYQKIEDPMQRLFWRTAIAPPSGKDMVFYWEGYVYLDIPGDVYAPPGWPPGQPGYKHGGGNGGTPIFGFKGYNIRKVVPHADPARVGDFIQSSRELVFYTWLEDGTDPATDEPVRAGDIVTSWFNPLTQKIIPVYPITNEFLWEHYRVGTYELDENGAPIFESYIDDGQLRSVLTINFFVPGPGCLSAEIDSPVSAPVEWARDYNWSFEVFPRYKLNDCGRWGINDPMNLKNEKYTSVEMFSFWVPKWTAFRLKLESKKLEHGRYFKNWLPPVNLNWTRIGSFPPWMGMYEGEATATEADNGIQGFDGRIIYAVRSELLKSYRKMPRKFRANMTKYFGEMNAQGLDTIGLFDGDGDGWEMAPAVHDPDIKRDTSYSVFYFKNMVPATPPGHEYQPWPDWVADNVMEALP